MSTPFPKDPISRVQWRDSRELKANHYNPNMVMTSELRLLERSILSQGWVQPILITPDGTIIDGFHRATLAKTSKPIVKKYGHQCPVVVLDIPPHRAMCLTVRINRAKGEHQAMKMSDLVKSLVKDHRMTEDEIAAELGATIGEIRLLLADDIFKRRGIDTHTYSRAWVPGYENSPKQKQT